ncbi:MAG: alpha/beta fold hydrolase [Deltaproteobacteria bacterium]|nr:alpha/beta fold hydrolase [Deltaproteobacteria bacterium]
MADTLHYEWIQAGALRFEVATAGDPASKKLALLLHGFPECAFSWRHQLQFLAERGYRVWAPNQRGYGNSPMPRGVASYRVDELVSDVANLIDASGAESVHLAGHDWGAIVAWEFAMRRARPLERLAIFNVPHPAIFREQIRNNKTQRRRSWYVAFFQLPWLPEYMVRRRNAAMIERAFRGMAIDKSRLPDDVIDVYRANALRPGGATAMINWYRAAGRSFGAEVATPVIETPTLMVWGEEDSALGKELTYGTERHVKDLTLRYLPQVSHWVQQEAPERVNEIWGAWLDGREVPGNTR